jgi:hypothetical protein
MGENAMTLEERICQLEKQNRRLMRVLSFGVVAVVALSLVAAAAADLMYITAGKIEVMNSNLETQTTLLPNGDVEVGGDLKVRGKVLTGKVDVLVRISQAEKVSQSAKKLVHAYKDVGVATVPKDWAITAFDGTVIPTQRHPFVNIDQKFPGPVVAAWTEIIDGSNSLSGFYSFQVQPAGDQVQLRATGNPNIVAGVWLRIHVLCTEN